MDIIVNEKKTETVLSNWWAQLRTARWLWGSILAFTITRLGILLVAYLAATLFADSSTASLYHLRGTSNLLIDVLGSRWDTGFYVSIAEEGYRYQGVPLPSVAFFPLYPLLMRAIGSLVGDVVAAGIIISNVALLLATMLLYRLADRSWGQAVAERTIWYFLIFPAAFFGTAVYSESLFLLVAIGALYFARRGFWEVAALLGIAAALTRFPGLLVAPMLLAEWWMQRQEDGYAQTRPSWPALLAGVAVPLGTLAYALYLKRTFGDPLAFIHGAAAWARQPQSPLVTVGGLLQTPEGGWWKALLAGHIHPDNWLDLGFVLFFLLLGFILLFKQRWSEGLFVTLGAAVALSSGLLMSQRRYVWVLFPAFILLAQWGERPWVDRVITTTSLLLLGIFVGLFARGYWVG
jgi:hypothetical protein